MDTGAWWTTVRGGHKELDMTEQLSTAQHDPLRFKPVLVGKKNLYTTFQNYHLVN